MPEMQEHAIKTCLISAVGVRDPLVFWAAAREKLDVLKLLLNTQKVDLNWRNLKNQTSLSYAAMCGHKRVVKLSIETGRIDFDNKDKWGLTPLSWAAINGDVAVASLLLQTDQVNVDSKDLQLQTSLTVTTLA